MRHKGLRRRRTAVVPRRLLRKATSVLIARQAGQRSWLTWRLGGFTASSSVGDEPSRRLLGMPPAVQQGLALGLVAFGAAEPAVAAVTYLVAVSAFPFSSVGSAMLGTATTTVPGAIVLSCTPSGSCAGKHTVTITMTTAQFSGTSHPTFVLSTATGSSFQTINATTALSILLTASMSPQPTGLTGAYAGSVSVHLTAGARAANGSGAVSASLEPECTISNLPPMGFGAFGVFAGTALPVTANTVTGIAALSYNCINGTSFTADATPNVVTLGGSAGDSLLATLYGVAESANGVAASLGITGRLTTTPTLNHAGAFTGTATLTLNF